MLPCTLGYLVFCAWFFSLPTLSWQALLGQRSLPVLTDEDLLRLTTPDPVKNLDPSDPTSHLSKILIPRPPGSTNNTLVRDYIVRTLEGLNWHVEQDSFSDNTPFGRKNFTNIIATKDPKASRRVVLSAHFDSKFFPNFPENQFVGATDSAAPCAMMLDLAQALNPLLDERLRRLEDDETDDGDEDDIGDLTIQVIFFDGEEAFINWSDTDSIYGARHLADKWESTYIQAHTKRRLSTDIGNELSGIEHLILLDLLGAPQPAIRSYFPDTAWLFDALADAEKRLGDSGAFAFGEEQGMAPGRWQSYFTPRSHNLGNMGFIGDDHVPFLHKGVPILHLISEPFPRVWHSLKDDASALDIPTMRRWSILLRVFMSEYLHLRPKDHHPRSVEGDGATLVRSVSELVSPFPLSCSAES